jgi:spore coat protein U-like protein
MNTSKKLLAAACATAALLMGGAAVAADSHTITVNATVAGNCKFNAGTSTVNMTLDPTATTTVTGNAAVLYRCTKGTSLNGAESIAYTFSSTNDGAGSGLGAGQDKTLSVTVSVNQANAANVTPNTYTDTIAITLTP